MYYRLTILFLLIFNLSYSATFKEILQKAIKSSPYLKSFEYQKNSYEGQILKAKTLYNPQIDLEFGRLVSQTESGFALTLFSISQQLRLWGEKDFAIKSAVLKKRAQEYFYNQQKNILAGQLFQLFYEVLFLNEQIRIKEKELKNLETLYSFIKKKYNLGDALVVDVLRIEKDISIVKLQIENLKAKKYAKESYLFALAGIKPEKLEGDFYKFEDLQRIDLKDLPLLKYYKLLVKSYDEEIKRQKVLAKPQISVGFVASEDAVSNGKYEFGITISSTLPIFYKNQGQIINLINKKKQFLEKERQYRLQYNAEIKSIYNQYRILTSQFKKVDDLAIKKLEESLKIAELGYKEGTITFLELSTIRKQYFEVLLYKAQLSYEIHRLYGEFIKLGGVR